MDFLQKVHRSNNSTATESRFIVCRPSTSRPTACFRLTVKSSVKSLACSPVNCIRVHTAQCIAFRKLVLSTLLQWKEWQCWWPWDCREKREESHKLASSFLNLRIDTDCIAYHTILPPPPKCVHGLWTAQRFCSVLVSFLLFSFSSVRVSIC